MSGGRASQRIGSTTALFAWIFATVALFGAVPSARSEEPPPAYPDAESVRPMAVGQTVPSAELRTIDGERRDLATLVADRGALLVFYRGGW